MRNLRNSVQLLGNLGTKPEIFTFENGNKKASFRLATDESYTNKKGEKVERTEWHNIVVRNKAAEICEKYLKKGDKVYIEGRIKTRKWTDDRGNDRYSTEIHCTDFTFLTPKEKPANPSENMPPQQTQHKQNEPVADDKDDLPF